MFRKNFIQNTLHLLINASNNCYESSCGISLRMPGYLEYYHNVRLRCYLKHLQRQKDNILIRHNWRRHWLFLVSRRSIIFGWVCVLFFTCQYYFLFKIAIYLLRNIWDRYLNVTDTVKWNVPDEIVKTSCLEKFELAIRSLVDRASLVNLYPRRFHSVSGSCIAGSDERLFPTNCTSRRSCRYGLPRNTSPTSSR